MRCSTGRANHHQGHEATFERSDALLNDEIVYVPYGWIGCVGFIVTRSTWTPVLLGSGIPVHVHVWAHYRGFANGETGADRPNDLVITAIKDRNAAQRTLRRVGNVPELDELPFRFRSPKTR